MCDASQWLMWIYSHTQPMAVACADSSLKFRRGQVLPYAVPLLGLRLGREQSKVFGCGCGFSNLPVARGECTAYETFALLCVGVCMDIKYTSSGSCYSSLACTHQEHTLVTRDLTCGQKHTVDDREAVINVGTGQRCCIICACVA